ncbi:hypothetical protein [Microbispora sp. ATCC PTA-5024]|uniref:hypothetical protein n=1 Tax=Microbispora sp. ATCC PTA-5024 TaxID=316330 RepID=UPI0003DDE3C7|nr:hypothetical protein [Microbispora sp. ATCC PTA-5024]ETK37900.1 hypothetical protein MPTA5024_01440 [Microbispora sp. ATCC PTA-5024]
MATPLQYGDPPHLGPFVLQARLLTAPAGLVYLGQGPDGRVVSVAVLTSGAALDAAARDRFVTAIREAQQSRSGVWAWGASIVDRVRGRAPVERPPVLAMQDGEAPWVAVPYVPGGPGAERFLDPVMVSGTLIGQRHGPDFVPHWLGDRNPALPAPPAPAPPPVATRRSVVLASTLLATLVVVLLVMLWLMLFRGDEDQLPPRPLPATNFVPTPPPVPTTPEPQQPSPTPSQGGTGSQTPAPEDQEDSGEPI